MKKLATLLICAFLSLSLTGCGKAVIKERVIRDVPPAALLMDCPEPKLAGDTVGALVDHAIDLQEALRQCNRDKSALRNWSKTE